MKPCVTKSVCNIQELVKHTSTNMNEILVYINQGNLSQSELWCYRYLSGASFSIFVFMTSFNLFITWLNESSPLTTYYWHEFRHIVWCIKFKYGKICCKEGDCSKSCFIPPGGPQLQDNWAGQPSLYDIMLHDFNWVFSSIGSMLAS